MEYNEHWEAEMIHLKRRHHREERLRRETPRSRSTRCHPFAWYEPAPGAAVVDEALVQQLAR